MGKGSTPLGRPMFDELEIKAHVWCEFRNLHERALEQVEWALLQQLEATNANARDRLAFRRRTFKAQGLCPMCGGQTETGHKSCRACIDKGSMRTTSRVQRLRAQGLCTCGRALDDGFKSCRICRTRALANYHKRMGHEHDA